MECSAFERLAVEQIDAVYRLALRLTRNRELAEDLVQDTFARALRPSAVASFDPGKARSGEGTDDGAMRSWLFTICHNVFLSRARRESKAPVAVAEFFEEASRERPPEEPPPAWDLAAMDWEQVDARLKGAIDDLKSEYRDVLLMWGADGLKYREIASILDVPIGTIMSRLHRARKIVTDALGPETARELGVRSAQELEASDE